MKPRPVREPHPICARLKRLRQEGGWSQREVAEAVGARQCTISDLETGQSWPSLQLVDGIAQFFGMKLTLNWSGEDDPV